MSIRSLLPTVLPVAFAATGLAQTGPYTAESFEAHRFQSGPLAGTDLWNGQDGWILLEWAYPPNLNAATVQGAVVRSGARAVKFDASLLTPGSFGELRRNAMFNLTSGVLEIELDFLITSSSDPSEWEIYSQPAPMPQSCYLRWWIAADGRVEYLDTPSRVLVQTNTFVAKDVWHHARTVVDVTNDRTEIHVDGVLVATGTPIATFGALPVHGFTQVNAYDAGNDAMYVDNFTVRERTAPHGLTVDLTRLPKDVRSVLTFRLAGGASLANRPYALAASMSGTSPGLALGSVVMPLNPDAFFGMVVAAFGQPHVAGFLGSFNGDGNAFATFDTSIPMPAVLLGVNLDFAYVTLSPVDAVSEPVRATVTLQ